MVHCRSCICKRPHALQPARASLNHRRQAIFPFDAQSRSSTLQHTIMQLHFPCRCVRRGHSLVRPGVVRKTSSERGAANLDDPAHTHSRTVHGCCTAAYDDHLSATHISLGAPFRTVTTVTLGTSAPIIPTEVALTPANRQMQGSYHTRTRLH